MEFPKKHITIYHKTSDEYCERYVLLASFRDVSIQNRNRTGVSSTDDVLVRIFTSDHELGSYNVANGDFIVDKAIDDQIHCKTGLTELRHLYGENNTYQVKSIERHIYGEELDHIKIGAI